MAILTNTLAEDGDTSVEWPGGTGSVFASGTFGSGTLTLQWSIDGGSTWVDANDKDGNAIALTDSGHAIVQFGPCHLRLSLADSTSPSINVRIVSHGFGR